MKIKKSVLVDGSIRTEVLERISSKPRHGRQRADRHYKTVRQAGVERRYGGAVKHNLLMHRDAEGTILSLYGDAVPSPFRRETVERPERFDLEPFVPAFMVSAPELPVARKADVEKAKAQVHHAAAPKPKMSSFERREAERSSLWVDEMLSLDPMFFEMDEVVCLRERGEGSHMEMFSTYKHVPVRPVLSARS